MSPSPSPPAGRPGPERPASELPDHLHYIAIDGVIGVGKTSLARYLAERFGGRTVLETVDENPFLPAFYEDPERWGFHTQLSYLASRFRQQKALLERDLFHRFVISDYTFDKDRIFAFLNLEGDELRLYESLYGLMEATIPHPDLVVYLRSSVDRLMRNIARRDRAYERGIDPAYIARLHEAYEYYFVRYDRGPLLVVNAAEMDFVHDEADRELLIRSIMAPPGERPRHVNPARDPNVPWPSPPPPGP